MEDNKSMMYVVAIIAIVAVVALIVMVSGSRQVSEKRFLADSFGKVSCNYCDTIETGCDNRCSRYGPPSPSCTTNCDTVGGNCRSACRSGYLTG